MEPIVLIIHLILALALVFVVLVQRSEGGGLGIGGGQGGLGSFASVRGTANFLTKLTWYLAIGFIITSIALAILSGAHDVNRDILGMSLETEGLSSLEGTADEMLGEETDQMPSEPVVPVGE